MDAEPIHVRDGNVITSAGVTAGIDLALALVEEDIGRAAALAVARHLVVYLRRPGGQAQFSAQLRAQSARREPLREVQQWISEHPAADLSVDRLAARAGLSPRQFARAFAAETGVPPGGTWPRSGWRRPAGCSRTAPTASSRSPGPAAMATARRCAARSSGPWASRPRPTGRDSDERSPVLKVAILLYDRFTTLDAVGPYEVLRRLRGAQVTFVAEQPGPVTADTGMLSLVAEQSIAELPHPDLVLVPGGPGQEQQMTDGPVHEWLRAADAVSSWTTSVCTGSLILAAAGLLPGRRATSHWLAVDRLAELRRAAGHRPSGDRREVRDRRPGCRRASTWP